jgi:hypothetical protein
MVIHVTPGPISTTTPDGSCPGMGRESTLRFGLIGLRSCQFHCNDTSRIDAHLHLSLRRMWLWRFFINKPGGAATTMKTDRFDLVVLVLSFCIGCITCRSCRVCIVCSRRRLRIPTQGDASVPTPLYTTPAPTREDDRFWLAMFIRNLASPFVPIYPLFSPHIPISHIKSR